MMLFINVLKVSDVRRMKIITFSERQGGQDNKRQKKKCA